MAELTLDKVAAIDKCAFYECTSLETLKLPACTRFGDYIVTGCSSLTRIEAAAAGDFVNIDDDTSNIGNTSVFSEQSRSFRSERIQSRQLRPRAERRQEARWHGPPQSRQRQRMGWGGGSGFLIQWKSISFP